MKLLKNNSKHRRRACLKETVLLCMAALFCWPGCKLPIIFEKNINTLYLAQTAHKESERKARVRHLSLLNCQQQPTVRLSFRQKENKSNMCNPHVCSQPTQVSAHFRSIVFSYVNAITCLGSTCIQNNNQFSLQVLLFFKGEVSDKIHEVQLSFGNWKQKDEHCKCRSKERKIRVAPLDSHFPAVFLLIA